MESLANYDSDEELETGAVSSMNGLPSACVPGLEGDNYEAVQMDMSENPLNGSKAPSVQALPQGRVDGALPNCAKIQSDSNCDSVQDDEDKSANEQREPQSSPASSPASTSSSNSSENGLQKSNTPPPQCETTMGKKDMDSHVIQKQEKREEDSHKGRARDKDRPREREAEDRDKRSSHRRFDRQRPRTRSRSRSRDRKERERERDREREKDRERERERTRRRSPGRQSRRSRERDERRRSRSRERPSPGRDHRRKEAERKSSESKGREHDRKRQRSRSRSGDRHQTTNDSRRSSSSSGSNKSDARCRDKAQPTSVKRNSRSRSRSLEKERPRGGDSRKFFLEKKLDRKMNVLERMGIELKPEAKLGCTGLVTPQMLVQRTMEQQAAQVKQATGVELPSYYNAAALNAYRLVDQMQKRKLLWSSKKEEQPNATSTQQLSSKWQGATFAQDQDGKLTAKFNRLMGIKQQPIAETPNTSSGEAKGSEIIKKQEEMFHNMESQYEVARLATHTHRGLGLGFGTFQPR